MASVVFAQTAPAACWGLGKRSNSTGALLDCQKQPEDDSDVWSRASRDDRLRRPSCLLPPLRPASRRQTSCLRIHGASAVGGDSPGDRRSPISSGFCSPVSPFSAVSSASSSIASLGAVERVGKPGVSFRRRVSEYCVEPYKTLYGIDPLHFDFDRKGEMRLNDEGLAYELRWNEYLTKQ